MDTIAYASDFTGSFSLWIGIIIGITASILVFRAARKMGGGLFGAVLNLVSVGMLSVALGSIFLALDTWFSPTFLKLAHTVFFSLGYICMVLGANKLLKGIMN